MPFTDQTTYNFATTNFNAVGAVYGIMNGQKQMIYIGQTDDLKRRMDEHRADRSHCMHGYAPALVIAEVISSGEAARRTREAQLLAEFRTPCNA